MNLRIFKQHPVILHSTSKNISDLTTLTCKLRQKKKGGGLHWKTNKHKNNNHLLLLPHILLCRYPIVLPVSGLRYNRFVWCYTNPRDTYSCHKSSHSKTFNVRNPIITLATLPTYVIMYSFNLTQSSYLIPVILCTKNSTSTKLQSFHISRIDSG